MRRVLSRGLAERARKRLPWAVWAALMAGYSTAWGLGVATLNEFQQNYMSVVIRFNINVGEAV
jgi:hypothetical protein